MQVGDADHGTTMMRTGLLATLVAGLVVVAVVLGDPGPPPPPCAFADGPPADSVVRWTPGPRAPKGPVGWEAFRRLDDLPVLPTGTQARMFSSADPAGGNHDGFDGSHLCRAPGGYVVAEHVGPGQLTSLWFTRGDGDVSANGRLRIVLDGVAVVDAPLQDVVDGQLGAPFVPPLVADAERSSGGVAIQVPMPFRRSMRVMTTRVPHFHRVQYQVFADPVGVATFDPSDPARDVVADLREAGRSSPLHLGPGARRVVRTVRLAPGEAQRPVRVDGPGRIAEIRLRLPRVPTLPQPGEDGAVPGSTERVVQVDPANDGVQLVRRSLASHAVQVAPVLVNEDTTPRSFSDRVSGPGGVLSQVLELPGQLTAGRREVLLADLQPGPATLVVRSRVDGTWVVSDRVELEGPPPAPPVDPAASARVLQGLRLQVEVDGRRTVDVPVGDFFGVGLGQRPVTSLMFRVARDGDYRAWWPMPVARRASVRVVNTGDAPVAGELQVVHEPGRRWASGLGPGGRTGHFRAEYRSAPTSPGRDWPVARVRGHGRLVGLTQTLQGRRFGRTYLEGDERVLVDGAASPQLHGTGTEDLYLAGWYFNRGPFSTPFSGHSAHVDGGTDHCDFECDAMWRVLPADGVPFHRELRLRIEHGVGNDFPADYRATTFWYGRDAPAMHRTDVLDVGDRLSEDAHGYTGTGERRSLAGRYPGDQRTSPVRDDLRATRRDVRFRMQVTPDNAGVLLRRRADQARGGQTVRVLVDGVAAGTWFQPEHNPVHRWLDHDLLLPASLTRGKRTIEVTLRPVAGAPPWTAARYEAHALQGPVLDRGGEVGSADLDPVAGQ